MTVSILSVIICVVCCAVMPISPYTTLSISRIHFMCVCRCVVCVVLARVAALFTINFNARAERSVLEYNKWFVSPACVTRLGTAYYRTFHVYNYIPYCALSSLR